MKGKITVIGSTNIDLIMKMENLPRLGETVTDAEFLQTFGGKGANQAVGAARAGGEVTFVSCVGDDQYADQVLENFRKDGIHCDFVFREKEIATGTALVMIGANGENYLSVAPGANYRMSEKHIDRAEPALRESEYILLQYEIPKETLCYAIDKCHTLGKKVIFNLAPARHLEDEYISKLHTLVVNQVEAELLTGQPVKTGRETRDAAVALQEKGARHVIITLGAEGSFIATPDSLQNVEAYRVKALDTTAAGDIYCGSLAVGLVEGMPLESAVKFAGAASAVSVTRLGAQPSAPTREEIETLMNGMFIP